MFSLQPTMRSSFAKLQRIANTTTIAPLSENYKRSLITLFNQSGSFLSSSEIPEAINSTLTNSNPGLPHHLNSIRFVKENNTANSKPLQKSIGSYHTEEIRRGSYSTDEFGEPLQWRESGLQNLSERDQMVRDALFGTDSNAAPGLHSVEDAEEQLNRVA